MDDSSYSLPRGKGDSSSPAQSEEDGKTVSASGNGGDIAESSPDQRKRMTTMAEEEDTQSHKEEERHAVFSGEKIPELRPSVQQGERFMALPENREEGGRLSCVDDLITDLPTPDEDKQEARSSVEVKDSRSTTSQSVDLLNENPVCHDEDGKKIAEPLLAAVEEEGGGGKVVAKQRLYSAGPPSQLLGVSEEHEESIRSQIEEERHCQDAEAMKRPSLVSLNEAIAPDEIYGEKEDEEEEERNIIRSGEGDHTPASDLSSAAPLNVPLGWMTAAALVGLLGILLLQILSSAPAVEEVTLSQVEVFKKEMQKVQSLFPNQERELWRRSKIHLQRHLQTAKPTEPVSLILVAGRGGETTLRCLASHLASAFSSALNSSVLQVDGASKAGMNSDEVKLELDGALRDAFGGKKLAAVIHRLEELPAGSTLIFYRYCDHENAAYKQAFLAFTVLLERGEELLSGASLGLVEEMVQDQLHHKFLSSDQPATFNRMDVDKLSGLWSRISHLILPVKAEEHMELHGCD
ncbi:torsin-1A-interacting protein 2-like isoform X2 [Denticeps clupeoides]|uniref:torsin-1A-interacting protein 2-like isoform X2 n=1 Tax=Denticeps clupeoides TaxID=299321 RepID=UPI0010A32E4B|nr:torsin-1A-interacting protein 2-like isoform X2 [Denticeps clupeoides]